MASQRDAEIAMHPTIKPIRLIADAILDCSGRGDIVLDAFAGVGTTLIAAEQTGRRGYGIEIDPHYVDTAIQRIDKVCGLKAIHVESKLSFDQLKNRTFRGTPPWLRKDAGTQDFTQGRPRQSTKAYAVS